MERGIGRRRKRVEDPVLALRDETEKGKLGG